jgi:2-succinyl-5-enolpyruvyl-6-hydroxy-3-cyclohexene-1-carboxylate synthase
MPLKQEGISDSHDSIIHLLLLLADCPSGLDGSGSRQKVSNRIYYTKKEAQALHRTHVEDQMRAILKEGLLPENNADSYSESSDVEGLE